LHDTPHGCLVKPPASLDSIAQTGGNYKLNIGGKALTTKDTKKHKGKNGGMVIL
jgi:hypothetical protein